MSHRPTLAEFVDRELRLSESAFGAIVDAVLKDWRGWAPMRSASAADALRVLHAQRDDFVRRAVSSLHEQTLGKAEPVRATPHKSGKLELSLVDDDEIT